MDPISASIVTALVAGAIEVVKPTATLAVKDAYGKLKGSLINKFGKDSDVGEAIQKVEERPDSAGRKALLEEELAAVEDQLDVEQDLAKALMQTITSYSATATGGSTIAQGESNVVAGSGGVAVGGNVEGGITMGDRISGDYVKGDKVLGDKIGSQINTGGGAFFGGSVTAGRDVVAGDQITNIGGDHVEGDNISVGNISGSSGVAIGRGAKVVGTQRSGGSVNYDELFNALRSIVANQAPELSGKVSNLKAQVALGSGADDAEMANLIQDIVDGVPGAKGAIVDLFRHSEVSTAVGPTTQFVLKRLQ